MTIVFGLKIPNLFPNLAKIHIFIPKSVYGGGGGWGFAGLGINYKKKQFFTASLKCVL